MSRGDRVFWAVFQVFGVLGLLQALTGCGAPPAAKSAITVKAPTIQTTYESFPVRARLIRLRSCWYVVANTPANDGGVCVIHAGDCDNPAHKGVAR